MNEVGLAGVGMAAVAMIGTIVNSIMGYRTTRDKLLYDAKIMRLEDSQARCLADHRECKEETTAIKVELKDCRDHHETSAADRATLHSKIAVLESKLMPA